MDKKLLSIGETSKLIGISIDTLRQWEKKGILQSFRPFPTSKRYYRQEDIDNFLNKPTENSTTLATNWLLNETPELPPSNLYCETSDIFHARLQKMENEISSDIYSLVTAITGEIGNNSYNHNIGNWPDIPGVFFAYNTQENQIVIADRGQGVLKTLRHTLPSLKNDQEALETAFTKYISGRAPESRGNGLKFVKDVVIANPINLEFCTGDAKLELKENMQEPKIKKIDTIFRGCIAIINF